MSRAALWVLILGMGATALTLRASFFLLQDRIRLPRWLQRSLDYVPPAVLAALVLPAFVDARQGVVANVAEPRFLAGLVAVAVAWRTKGILPTLLAGMAALWLLDWLVF